MVQFFDLNVYLVLDPDMCGGHQKSLDVAKDALLGGATIIQLRAPTWHKKALLELAKDLLRLTKEFDVPLLINDHVDVAMACDADGVHVGRRDLPPQIVRQLLGPQKIIGYSVTDEKSMNDANMMISTIDYVGIGPIFATATKPDHDPPIGINGLQRLCSLSNFPSVAIGSVNLQNAVDVFKTGIDGVAVVSAICAAKDPKLATETLVKISKEFKQPKNYAPKNRPIEKLPNVLTIAGTDPSGGAGVQADLKTFGALKTYGLSVATVIVAQNTHGVQSLLNLEPGLVRDQLKVVFGDFQVDAIKIGALGDEKIVHEVAKMLREQPSKYVVLDPVILTKSGHHLLSESGIKSIIEELFSLATLITPNLPEAAALLNEPIATNEQDMIEQGRRLCSLGAQAVLMKGGHLDGNECPDWLVMDNKAIKFDGKRLTRLPQSGNKIGEIHGTGCTLSSAITANLTKNNGNLEESIKLAKEYLNKAILASEILKIENCKTILLNHLSC